MDEIARIRIAGWVAGCLVVCAAGCGFDSQVSLAGLEAPAIDGSMPPSCDLGDPLFVDPCTLASTPGAGLELSGSGVYVYDTDALLLRDVDGATPIEHTSVVVSSAGVEVVVVLTDSFVLGAGAELQLRGSRPFVLASWSTITIDGELDARSTWTGGPAAGANSGTCAPPGDGEGTGSGAAGGGGGALGGRGGAGGAGDDGNVQGAVGGTPAAQIDGLRGGCPGGDGGDNGAGQGGAGGAGGGAVLLVAGDSVAIAGTVHAGGSGGRLGELRDGGGGGGSGGVIALSAPTVSLGTSALVASNGGGGGEGGSNSSNGHTANPGSMSSSATPGASGTSSGGDGGAGGAGVQADGQDGEPSKYGGGGGGGSVGFVLVHAVSVNLADGATVSPAPTRR